MNMAEEELVCPIKRDYLKKWSEQIPPDLWGKLEPYIKACPPLKVAREAQTKKQE